MEFGARIVQQIIGIPTGTYCAPLLADLFLYMYGAEFIQGLMKVRNKNALPNNSISPTKMMYYL